MSCARNTSVRPTISRSTAAALAAPFGTCSSAGSPNGVRTRVSTLEGDLPRSGRVRPRPPGPMRAAQVLQPVVVRSARTARIGGARALMGRNMGCVRGCSLDQGQVLYRTAGPSRDSLGPRQQTLGVELRARRESDLDACEHLAHVVHAADGYPPRCADDLRLFVSAPGALGAWVAESENGIVGHVALLPRSARAVMAVGRAATGRPPEQLCVVARLFVSPTGRTAGIGRSLLTLAAEDALARGLQPILDVAAHLDKAIRLYERAGWMCAGQVTVDFRNEAPLEELVYIGPDPGGVGL